MAPSAPVLELSAVFFILYCLSASVKRPPEHKGDKRARGRACAAPEPCALFARSRRAGHWTLLLHVQLLRHALQVIDGKSLRLAHIDGGGQLWVDGQLGQQGQPSCMASCSRWLSPKMACLAPQSGHW